MKKKVFIILFLFLVIHGCSKKSNDTELKYTALDFMGLAHEARLSNEKGSEGINFTDYAPGVNRLESKGLIYKQLIFFAICFETVEQARLEALRLNQYYARNWLFDRVEGEPVLEDYVISTFKASNPKKRIQRIPKTHESHAEGKASEIAPTHH